MKLKDFGALLLLAALWGVAFLFIRIASPVLGPVFLVNVRVVISGLVLLMYALAIKKRPQIREKWKQYLLLGAINAAIPFTLISTSSLNLTASITATINATTPLFAAVIGRIWLKETLTWKKMVGIPFGIVSVFFLVGWSPTALTLPVLASIGFSLLAALFYAIGGAYTKLSLAGEPPLTLAIGQQLGAGLLLIPFSLLNPPQAPITGPVALAVLALAIISTSIGYSLYFYLVTKVGPTKTLSVTFLVPLFGIFFGALFLHETITLNTIVGVVMILGSTMLASEVKFKKGAKQLKAESENT